MYDTGGSHSVCWPSTQDVDIEQRLSRLGHELSPEVQRRRLGLEREERRALSMLEPTTTEEAYRWFGTFLGLFPPFAIFNRSFLSTYDAHVLWVALLVAMNVVCCLVGRRFGAFLGRWVGDPRSHSRLGFPFFVFIMAIAWSVVTGGLGGALFFGIGAIFGPFFAAPVALVAFPVFSILHRLLSHGGMIEERQVWPLVFGVPLTITAMILSPWIQ